MGHTASNIQLAHKTLPPFKSLRDAWPESPASQHVVSDVTGADDRIPSSIQLLATLKN